MNRRADRAIGALGSETHDRAKAAYGSSLVRRGSFGLALIVVAMAFVPAARADMVLLEQTGWISGNQSFVFPVLNPGAGTMHVTLTTLDWPTRLSSLSFALSTATSVLQRFGEPGQFSFEIGSAGSFYAHIAGTAQGRLQLGVYSLRITFAPLTAPVPLPASAWLLMAGLAALGASLRKRGFLQVRGVKPASVC